MNEVLFPTPDRGGLRQGLIQELGMFPQTHEVLEARESSPSEPSVSWVAQDGPERGRRGVDRVSQSHLLFNFSFALGSPARINTFH